MPFVCACVACFEAGVSRISIPPPVSRRRRRYLNGFRGGCRGGTPPHASAALKRKTKMLPHPTDPTIPNQLESFHTSGAKTPTTPRSLSQERASADSHQTPRKKSAPTAQNPTSPSSPPPPLHAPSPAASYAHPHCPPRCDCAGIAPVTHQTAPDSPATSYNPHAAPAHRH